MSKFRILKYIFVSCLGIILGLGSVSLIAKAATTVHSLSWDSVDSGGYVDYDIAGSSAMEPYFSNAISQWGSLGSAKFRLDTTSAIEDLGIVDVWVSDVGWFAKVTYYAGLSDTMEFNRTKMDSLSSTRKKYIVAHEFGHTVGVGDHYESKYANIVMYGYGDGSYTPTTLTTHDKDDYNIHW